MIPNPHIGLVGLRPHCHKFLPVEQLELDPQKANVRSSPPRWLFNKNYPNN